MATDGPRTREGAHEVGPVTGRFDLRMLGPALLGFWCLYFAIVTLSNLTDLFRFVRLLPADWSWVSGNLAFIASSTAKVSMQAWLSPVLLGGVILWQGLASILFGRAVWRGDAASLGPAFVVSISLWATFILLDEVLLIFETGAEATHLRLLIAQLLSLCLLRPDGLRGKAEGSSFRAG